MFEQSGEDLIKCLKSSNLTEVTQLSIKFVEAGTLVKKRAEWTETKSVIIAIESHYGNNFSEHVQRASFITFIM